DLSGRSAPLAEQLRALSMQLVLAAELDLPVVVHMRDAARELRDALGREPAVRGQLHCYSEGPAELGGWAALGLVPSFAGTVTFARNDRLREAAARAERLLVETDAPYLAPEPRRGERNEPLRVRDTYERIAALRGSTPERLAAEVGETARALFGPRW
ncbi:MAG TPA: TatD family hydrolase, partial [Candidatus Limnocylindria bacterium]|nr:TatD family hydrolase [Candidatus Limnocylindria bacterium]